MVAAGVVALSTVIYVSMVRRINLHRVVVMTLVLLGVTSAMLPFLMSQFSSSLAVFAFVYLLAQVRGSLGTIQFATLFNEQFSHEPERVVGLVGAGATLAGISVGLSIGFVSQYINVELLMYAAAVIDLITIVPVLLLPRATEPSTNAESPAQDAGPKAAENRKSHFVLGIAAVMLLSVLVATLIEYQWKVTAAEELLRDEGRLARFFGFFYGGVYLLTGVLQLLVTGRVLQQRGVLVGLLIYPVAVLISTAMTLLMSSSRVLLWTVTLTKGCDTFRRSMHEPSIQVLYSPLAVDYRRQSIAFVAGIVKPFAEAIAAVLLVVLTPWLATYHFSWLIVAMVVAWLGLDFVVFRRFSRLNPS